MFDLGDRSCSCGDPQCTISDVRRHYPTMTFHRPGRPKRKGPRCDVNGCSMQPRYRTLDYKSVCQYHWNTRGYKAADERKIADMEKDLADIKNRFVDDRPLEVVLTDERARINREQSMKDINDFLWSGDGSREISGSIRPGDELIYGEYGNGKTGIIGVAGRNLDAGILCMVTEQGLVVPAEPAAEKFEIAMPWAVPGVIQTVSSRDVGDYDMMETCTGTRRTYTVSWETIDYLRNEITEHLQQWTSHNGGRPILLNSQTQTRGTRMIAEKEKPEPKLVWAVRVSRGHASCETPDMLICELRKNTSSNLYPELAFECKPEEVEAKKDKALRGYFGRIRKEEELKEAAKRASGPALVRAETTERDDDREDALAYAADIRANVPYGSKVPSATAMFVQRPTETPVLEWDETTNQWAVKSLLPKSGGWLAALLWSVLFVFVASTFGFCMFVLAQRFGWTF